ncbi:MAG TPA: transaldolase [Isosphaeraceae bacterium]|jgi:transaldolase|nr:transaldolase [Isosphaeraceae bacterium]
MATATTTRTSPLADLQALGQSVWLDFMGRKFVEEGELRRLIEEDDLRGVTSNPTIFEKAIGHGDEYASAFDELLRGGADGDAIYEGLTVADIRGALDLFRPVYDRTDGLDGYVSLEVSPLLAHRTDATLIEARKLWDLIDRPNAMIKIPGTPEGLAAVEEALFDGINVNVTLLFSVEAYDAVARAYIRALKRRADLGRPIDRVASVASFFVSRIDSEVDKRIDTRLRVEPNTGRRAVLQGLRGKAAIANAKDAYARFRSIFKGPEFAPFEARGARVQRLLWASVGTKDPAYSDTLYIDELIGPDTVSTMPPATFAAFKDHGKVRPSLAEDPAGAQATLRNLSELGISMDDVTSQLLREGVDSFARSFRSLMETIAQRRSRLATGGDRG